MPTTLVSVSIRKRPRSKRIRRGLMCIIGMTMFLVGQDATAAPPEMVATDRPDYANSTITTPIGAALVELGLSLGLRETPGLRVPTTIRIGVAERVELRIFDSDDLVDPLRGGAEDVGFGAKIRLLDSGDGGRRMPSLGLQPLLHVPRRLRAGPGGSVLGILSQPLGRRSTLDLNFGPEVHSQVRYKRARAGLFGAASLAFAVAPTFTLYAEVYGDARLDRRASAVGADAGWILIARRRFAFDASTRYEFQRGSRDVIVGVGMTIMFDRCNSNHP